MSCRPAEDASNDDDISRHQVHRASAFSPLEAHVEVGLLLALPWIERVAQAVTDDVEGEDGERDHDAREDGDVRVAGDVRAGLVQRAAPGRGRRLHAETEE